MNVINIYTCPYYKTGRCPKEKEEEMEMKKDGESALAWPPECKYPFLRVKADGRPICKLTVDIDSPDVIGGLGYLSDRIEFVDRSLVRDMEVPGT